MLPRRSFLLLAGIAALNGCASVPPGSCAQFEQSRKAMRYDSVYRYSAADTRLAAKSFVPVGRPDTIAVRWYTLRTNRTDIRPCDHLYLTTDAYLLRNPGVRAVLTEHREFYTADGALIATKRDDVSDQLRASGFYSASVPLPIPEGAPAGSYRIVMRLVVTLPEAAERTLATTSAEFRVHR